MQRGCEEAWQSLLASAGSHFQGESVAREMPEKVARALGKTCGRQRISCLSPLPLPSLTLRKSRSLVCASYLPAWVSLPFCCF